MPWPGDAVTRTRFSPLPQRRTTPPPQYDGNEYAALPDKYRILRQMSESLLRPVVPMAYVGCMKMVV